MPCRFSFRINKGVLYVKNNELTQFLTIVHAEPPNEGKQNADDSRLGDSDHTQSEEGTRSNGVSAGAATTVGCEEAGQTSTAAMHEAVALIDQIYPKMKIDLVSIKDMHFGPIFVEWISEMMKISKNKMFIMCPDSKFKHSLGAFGGVRVISGGSSGSGKE